MVATWLVLCCAIGIVAVEGALHPGRRLLKPSDENLARFIAAHAHAELTDVVISAQDGAMLHAWSFAPLKGNGDAVILLHGQADNRAGMLGNADLLLHRGYVVLLPDARAHGESGGQLATYGVLEARDIRSWFDWLEHKQTLQCIDGLGDSMGGAQLLNSLEAEPHFCAVIAESSFSDFQSAGYDRLGQEFHAGPWLGRTVLRPAIEAGFLYVRWRYGIDLKKASPIDAVHNSRTSALLIHGLADTNLPPSHSELIRQSNSAVELWEPPGAGHCGASGAAPDEYERRIIGWFMQHQRVSTDGKFN